MPQDRFPAAASTPSSPAEVCFAIVPSDSAELTLVTKGIYIGTEGSVRVLPLRSDTEVTFANVPAGSILDVRVRAVRATGTTAANLVGMA